MAQDKKKILVIDDEDDIRLVVTTRLERAGYATIVAADGLEGLRHFYNDRPDLVVLDIAMPEMDGWQVLERIREVSNLPVLMLTAAAQERDKVRGLRGARTTILPSLSRAKSSWLASKQPSAELLRHQRYQRTPYTRILK